MLRRAFTALLLALPSVLFGKQKDDGVRAPKSGEWALCPECLQMVEMEEAACSCAACGVGAVLGYHFDKEGDECFGMGHKLHQLDSANGYYPNSPTPERSANV